MAIEVKPLAGLAADWLPESCPPRPRAQELLTPGVSLEELFCFKNVTCLGIISAFHR